MDQRDMTPGTGLPGTGSGGIGGAGAANTPSFDRPETLSGVPGSGTGGSSGGYGASAGGYGGGGTAPQGGTAPGSGSGASEGGSSGGSQGGGQGVDTQQLKERAGQALGQVEERANQAMGRAAGGLESAAQKLGQLADDRLQGSGAAGRAGQVAHSTADTMESIARYLRDNDSRKLMQDLETQVRERPLQTLLFGVAAGWLAGKILR